MTEGSKETTTITQGGDVTIIAGQVSDEYGVLAEGAIAVEGDHALVVARFADTTSARAIYDNLLAGEVDGSLHIDGVLVVKADDDGRHPRREDDRPQHPDRPQVGDRRRRRRRGLPAGHPGRRRGDARRRGRGGRQGAQPLASTRCRGGPQGVITPGTSGILALVTAADAPAVEAKMPDAEEVKTVPVDEATAGAIKEAAAEAEATTPSGT